MDLVKVEDAAKRFRNAIESADRSQLSEGFRGFPTGSCSDASRLLAKFLKHEGLGEFQVVSGVADFGSHSWLELDGVLVDITADQFAGIDTHVKVGTSDSWYETFSGGRKTEAAELDDDIIADVQLAASFRLILQHL